MSETKSEKDAAPTMCLVQIRVERWANCAVDRGGWLIDLAHLAPVNRALDECVRFMESRSIPTLRQKERLVPRTARDQETWLFEVNPDLSEADKLGVVAVMHAITGAPVFHRLRDAVIELKRQWDNYVREAEARPGSRVSETGIPPATDLHKHFIAWGECDGEKDITSRAILGAYSTFEPPPLPPPDPLLSMFASFDYIRELEALYELRRSGKLTGQELSDRFEELNSKYPCDGTWGKS